MKYFEKVAKKDKDFENIVENAGRGGIALGAGYGLSKGLVNSYKAENIRKINVLDKGFVDLAKMSKKTRAAWHAATILGTTGWKAIKGGAIGTGIGLAGYGVKKMNEKDRR